MSETYLQIVLTAIAVSTGFIAVSIPVLATLSGVIGWQRFNKIEKKVTDNTRRLDEIEISTTSQTP